MPNPFTSCNVALVLVIISSLADAATHRIGPESSIQTTIDQAQSGDTIILESGVYHEVITINRSITLKAQNPGEVTVTNRHPEQVRWRKTETGGQTWHAQGITWPVHWLFVEGIHAFDYRTRANFEKQVCGPYWSKGWQEGKQSYTVPPLYFAHDAEEQTLWLKLDDDRDPNTLAIDFNSSNLGGRTLVQKDLGTRWNQQDIVTIASDPPVHPIIMWYVGSRENPDIPRLINFPRACGIVINVEADDVSIEGLRIHLAPTVGVEVNNSKRVNIRNCYFSGYQFGINSGYEAESLSVAHCEFDGGKLLSYGGHENVNLTMWNHSIYVNPVKFNGVGLAFHHNYVYEGFDLFHPRGRHKDFGHVPNLRSDVAYNVWQANIDNVAEFDGVEALMNLRFHHNLVLGEHDTLAITTTENGGPLTIDHNLWWPGGNRIMKLLGTGRLNRGVHFIHNTYFSGDIASHNRFEESLFENNIIISECETAAAWSEETLGAFFPTRFNLLLNGHKYTEGFEGLTQDPRLGGSPESWFILQEDSPAINQGRTDPRYYQDNVSDGKPDLGTLEYGQTIEDWRNVFGHCGPEWITANNASAKAPNRPPWPKELDRRWGGLD